MKHKNRLLLLILIPLILCIGLLYIYFLAPSSDVPIVPEDIQADFPVIAIAEDPTPEPEPEPEPVFEEYDLHLMAVGDDLIHMGIANSGKQEDGTYNFDFLFEAMHDYLDAADIKIINQETIFGGDDKGASGYPHFNSPSQIGDSLVAAGFNVILQATNHSADMGIDGLLNAVHFWRENYPDVLMVGIYDDPAESETIPIMEIDGFKFAILNYTYGPNMETIPSNIVGHLSILCNYNESSKLLDFTSLRPQVLEDIARAKEEADIVIVCPHWGTEYTSKPSTYQINFAEAMTEAGADLIIGTHPHVPQPIEWVTSDNGNKSLVYYSLGNYVSTQKGELSMLEELAWVTFHVTEEGISIAEDKCGALPLVNQYSDKPTRYYGTFALEDYTEELAAIHGIRTYGGVNIKLENLQNYSADIIGDMALTKADILEDFPSKTTE